MTHDRIERNSEVMMGKPVIKGTRVTVELIVRNCAAGMSWREIADDYHLTLDDIQAALNYAADYLGHESLIAAE